MKKKPTMTVKEAKQYAEAAAHLYGKGELVRMSAMPQMLEALAVLHTQLHCVTTQLNKTKERLQNAKQSGKALRDKHRSDAARVCYADNSGVESGVPQADGKVAV